MSSSRVWRAPWPRLFTYKLSAYPNKVLNGKQSRFQSGKYCLYLTTSLYILHIYGFATNTWYLGTSMHQIHICACVHKSRKLLFRTSMNFPSRLVLSAAVFNHFQLHNLPQRCERCHFRCACKSNQVEWKVFASHFVWGNEKRKYTFKQYMLLNHLTHIIIYREINQ